MTCVVTKQLRCIGSSQKAYIFLFSMHPRPTCLLFIYISLCRYLPMVRTRTFLFLSIFPYSFTNHFFFLPFTNKLVSFSYLVKIKISFFGSFGAWWALIKAFFQKYFLIYFTYLYSLEIMYF